jgi:hypothetical protein
MDSPQEMTGQSMSRQGRAPWAPFCRYLASTAPIGRPGYHQGAASAGCAAAGAIAAHACRDYTSPRLERSDGVGRGTHDLVLVSGRSQTRLRNMRESSVRRIRRHPTSALAWRACTGWTAEDAARSVLEPMQPARWQHAHRAHLCHPPPAGQAHSHPCLAAHANPDRPVEAGGRTSTCGRSLNARRLATPAAEGRCSCKSTNGCARPCKIMNKSDDIPVHR